MNVRVPITCSSHVISTPSKTPPHLLRVYFVCKYWSSYCNILSLTISMYVYKI